MRPTQTKTTLSMRPSLFASKGRKSRPARSAARSARRINAASATFMSETSLAARAEHRSAANYPAMGLTTLAMQLLAQAVAMAA